MHYDVDIAVIGGGLGGVAAALAACEAGCTVLLSEATDWLGGQITAQGVSALDEHERIEDEPPTRAYAELRQRIRQHYIDVYGAPAIMADGAPLNPGNGWVSRLCFEPRIGLAALNAMLAPHIAGGRLIVLIDVSPVAAAHADGIVRQVTLRATDQTNADDAPIDVRARLFIDATELGDLLPLTETAYVSGAEARADTGEPNAADMAQPGEVQSCTFCFAVELDPGGQHVIAAPHDYARMRDAQPYSLKLGTPPTRYFMQRSTPESPLPFWTYRRLLDAQLLDPTGARGLRDIALINWHGNDFHDDHLIDKLSSERAHAIAAAKRLALGFLYWLQTEAPHDDDSGIGFPGLRLLPEVMGTHDGLSKTPYARESRRIRARTRIVEQDISARIRTQPGDRARDYNDCVGLGWYPMDLHPAVGNPLRTMFSPTHPFQIPLGALIPLHTQNLLAACKNIGTTHLTNGAYRLHPVEWTIGEAAGTLAAQCCATGDAPGVRLAWRSDP
jgi:hypothetical protein